MIKINEQNQQSKSPINNLELNNHQQLKNGSILFENFTCYWNQDFKNPTLTNINFMFKKGKMYGITGKVGAGKSSILAAILSEIPYYSGNINLKGSIAYVEQEPVIFSDTIKNNITFGASYQKKRYARALQLSCLINDISTFEKGEQTIVGEKGTTLSGGQKIRLSLARALYTNADIYLLDDPISAVDSKVAKNIYSKIVQYLSKQKTVILVTHQINYLYNCDEVIVLQQGKIMAEGTPFQINNILNQLNEQLKDTTNQKCKSLKEFKSKNYLSTAPPNLQTQIITGDQNLIMNNSVKVDNRFAEKQEDVNLGIYIDFITRNKWNYLLLPLSILLSVCNEVILALYYRILSKYQSVKSGTQLYFGNNFNLFWSLSILLILTNILTRILKYYFLNMCLLNSTKNIHQMMLKSIIRSPNKFFDLTPSGILINKFTNDLGVVDNNLIYPFIYFVEAPIAFIVILVNMFLLDFSLAIFMIPLTLTVAWLIQHYQEVLILCKQLFLQNKNELVHFFRENIAGMTQIRITGRRKNQLKEVSRVLNKELRANFGFQITSKGFSYFITLIIIVYICIALVYLIYFITPEKVPNFSVCVIYLTYLIDNAQFFIRNSINTNCLMVSTQRLLAFNQLEQQKDLQADLNIVDGEDQIQKTVSDSVRNVKIKFKNYSGRYRQDLSLALKNLNLSIQKGQKIGIVGRTGAGKSSIIQALYRILQPESGSIYQIGGANCLEMGIHRLRRRFGIIPQTPFIFKGSIRYNIDPQGLVSDEKIWSALNKVGLSEYIKSLPNQLQTQISSSSQSFSTGQKQLLSLTRVLLFRKNLLVLDEATSNVDIKTDALMQQTIRKQFKDTTIITVAHRLNTVADYDKIIVMHEGRIIEEGSYNQLVSKRVTFYDMVENYRKNTQSEE